MSRVLSSFLYLSAPFIAGWKRKIFRVEMLPF